MKKTLKRILVAVIAMTMLFSAMPVSAAKQVESKYVKIYKPKHKKIVYRGESFNYKFKIKNPWDKYLCQPVANLINKDGKVVRGSKGGYLNPKKSGKCSGAFSTVNLAPGEYYFKAEAVPIKNDTKKKEVSSVRHRYARNSVIVRELKPVRSVRASAGVGKVTITFKPAVGATSYKVFRSISADKGYNMIGSTETTYYEDTDVNQGERYYYRIVSVRNKTELVASNFSNFGYSKPVK